MIHAKSFRSVFSPQLPAGRICQFIADYRKPVVVTGFVLSLLVYSFISGIPWMNGTASTSQEIMQQDMNWSVINVLLLLLVYFLKRGKRSGKAIFTSFTEASTSGSRRHGFHFKHS